MKARFTDWEKWSADQLSTVAVLARVVHYGSFTKAAIELGVSTSALSQTIRALEDRAGIRLLNRTTRRVATTEAGQRFLANALPALDMLNGAFAELAEQRGTPAGTLRINLSRAAAEHLVAPVMPKFAQQYPDIVIDLTVDDGLADLVSGGFDCGIRLGEHLAQSVVAIPIGPKLRMAVVASPEYFAKYGVPETPADLESHNCLRYRFRSNSAVYRWEFTERGRDYAIDVGGGLIANDSSMITAAARNGWGIACALDISIADDVASGRLQRVLAQFCPPFDGFHLYYPHRVQMPLKMRVFVDSMAEYWGGSRTKKK
jgi:DNA-binding transcriptional LysR family regulator